MSYIFSDVEQQVLIRNRKEKKNKEKEKENYLDAPLTRVCPGANPPAHRTSFLEDGGG
jgi:hypothetical protein